ncbi:MULTISPECIES: sensor histidine kinase [Oceanobacillus]|uniref:sensor histidine kinase n=1 Tax=Oceanobacillus TaxID=182709 RepID=UPI00211702CE|nr:HAMP domain-containing sensor histidine kinase [Oceanobacillus oncorhynchi]MDM8100150.1 HAMP domain-containing sensor histidine kinase [Oceanobacillus oncorhynchi]UUI41029.1 HAMP domain-containing histidine kinase [Oceanobacillus oncorhynchi]
MKLQSQLNAAFTALLLVIMTTAGLVIYSLVLDVLIQDEQRQLAETGELLISFLSEQYDDASEYRNIDDFLKDQELQLFLYDRNLDTVLFSTMSISVVNEFFQENNFEDNEETLWQHGNDRFVTQRIIFSPEQSGMELILLTPINDLRAVQQNFFFRLAWVFLIGALAAVILSYYMTNKLVTPLSLLKKELKKVENRQFDQMKRIRASGEIKEVEQSVYEMSQTLEQYMKSQQTFFQNASHELKTPLMTIQGYAEGIRDGIFDEKDTEKGLDVMVTEVNRLKKIINEMILLAKLDSQPDVYEETEIDVQAFVDGIVSKALPIVNENKLDLHQKVDGCITIHADEEKLLRAVSNVVFNAIRYANKEISIHVYKKKNMIFFDIEDDGKGITEEDMDKIFHRFIKGKGGETGLGLAIARAIIEQSNGKIYAGQSKKLGGAKFTMCLPVSSKPKGNKKIKS